jgi:2-iminobutanoate/2-iminopropanoate deaminase
MNKKIIRSEKAPAPIGPYSQAILINGVLYMSGQIGIDSSTGQMVNEDIMEETHQVLKNMEAILAQAGMSLSNVVKCSIFVKDLTNFGTINTIYNEYFRMDPPARETVEVSRLPKDANVEISCIAVQ